MTTVQFLMSVLNWLQADPSHVIVAATLADSLIPTPDPRTPLGKLYKVLELFALSFMHAKETGLPSPTFTTLAEQVADAVVKKQATFVASIPAVPPAAPAASPVAPIAAVAAKEPS